MSTESQDWQKEMLKIVKKYNGKGVVQMTGRQTGKSQMAAYARLWQDIIDPDRPVESLELSEGRISGARYYCVEPKGGNWTQIELWAATTFGAPGEIWPKEDFIWPDNMRWCMNNRKFWFRNEKDRTMFIMKWSR